ncbi:unnamed protein product, partial [Ixodes pacificus]
IIGEVVDVDVVRRSEPKWTFFFVVFVCVQTKSHLQPLTVRTAGKTRASYLRRLIVSFISGASTHAAKAPWKACSSGLGARHLKGTPCLSHSVSDYVEGKFVRFLRRSCSDVGTTSSSDEWKDSG